MSKEPRWRLLELPEFRNKPGFLVVLEFTKLIPDLFSAAPRVYVVGNDTEKPLARGGHYHPPGGKQEVWVCLNGTARVVLHSKEGCGELTLDRPSQALVIPSEIWHEVTLSPGANLVAMVSTLYSSNESVENLPCEHGTPSLAGCGC